VQQFQKVVIAIAVGMLASGGVMATNGYAPHGIGMTSKGMGGVTIAYQGDAVALGGNPAGSAFMHDRVDVGVDIFRPIRSADLDFGPGGTFSYDGSDKKWFALPEFGYRHGINDKIAVGVSVFGNGGMNSSYKPGIPLFNGALGPAPNAPATGPTTGINLMQLFVVPSASYKINDDHAIGLGVNLVAQGFEAKGLAGFTGFTSNPAKFTDNGTEWSYGAGLRLGWVGKVTPDLTIGATYQSRTWMTEFDDYAGLFAEQGDFDVPSNFGIGAAWQATPELLVAADVMRINYSEVDSIGNSINNLLLAGAPLGASNGPGFGWEDVTVIKLGVEYQFDPKLTLRAGWNYGESQIPGNQETLFNVLAPATVEHHLTLGGTWQVNPDMAITAAYMHAFEKEIDGTFPPAPPPGLPAADIRMYQDSFGIAVSWKL
jgi:long-chain fatty acid transport protein